jgi:hypothetical protein
VPVSERQSAPDLGALEQRYEVEGELRGDPNSRRLIGRRRDSGTEVTITVATVEHSAGNNALAHYASDAQTLMRVSHPRLARVLEGRWTGADAFAVVTERIHGTTLHELLSSGTRLPNPRIAALLHEVNDVLAWARSQGVVHRGVTAETLMFERESQAARMTLGLTPIPLEGLPDAAADARTIGTLAWAMLAGRAYTPETPDSLRDLRRDLAQRVIDETTAMVNHSAHDGPPDVERFLSVIAMGDVLREGELEIARMQADMVEERRVERVRLEAEARAHADRAEALEARLRKERAEFERHIKREEARIASDQQQVAVERSQFEQERSQFTRRVIELERLRSEAARRGVETPPLPTAVPEFVEPDDAILHGGNRFGWIIPVATIGLLVLLIFIGALMARHRPVAPRSVNIGTSTVIPTETQPNAGVIPRGGFLIQSGGNVGSREARRTSSDSASVRRRDTTVVPPRP